MQTAGWIEAVAVEGRSLAAAAGKAGPDSTVPTCPGWQIRDLLRHTGMVHRWAAAFVIEGHTSYRPDGGEPDLDGDMLLDWFKEGHQLLVTALDTAPADLACWTFLPAPSPLAFWARRQAHETTVHRVDAESALGAPATVPAALAADGISELLNGFHARAGSRVRTDTPRTLRIRATDTHDVWTVRLSAQPPLAEHGGSGPVDCELSGPVDRLYLTLWNRLPHSAVEVAGDAGLAELWRERSAVTWS
ncbi:maleylpyruvate isomerase family mycothiol-dependent enzyme [Streptomyces sp. NPDC127084]|uniref:maleylpyruvate isomerase family mycothiol-dependent enzyme n=1 Tax=Streptomyces sp. NPDC127084 TaxID=3347133 RepID=UPI003659835E